MLLCCLLQVLMECDPPVLRIESIKGEDGKPDLCIHLDRSRIQDVAKPAVGRFLEKLQVSSCLTFIHWVCLIW